VMRFIGANGVIAGPFAIVKTLAKREGSFVKRSSNRHWVVRNANCQFARKLTACVTVVRASDYSYADS